MKYADNIYSILCDDVRTEMGGKLSLMGLYQKDIIFNKLPAQLPLINFVIFLDGIKSKFSKLSFKISIPGDKPLNIDRNIEGPEIKINSTFVIFIGVTQFTPKKSGIAKFEVKIDDSKKPIHTLKVNIKTREQYEKEKDQEKNK